MQQELDVFMEQAKQRREQIELEKARLDEEHSKIVTDQYKAENVIKNLTKLLG